jgi:D-serine deaminase-like pyridoxal phosphate-dependent protein
LTVPDLDQKRRLIQEAMAVLVGTKQQLIDAGLPCDIVSAGGTGSCLITIECPGITELQAGGLIFMDAYYRHRCQVDCFDHSLKLITTVVSRPTNDRAIIDAGRKAHNAEIHNPIVVGRDDIRVTRLSAEHGQLELDATAQDLRIGDRLELIPGYSDFTCVLHNAFYAVRDRRVDAIWPLAGRGMLR